MQSSNPTSKRTPCVNPSSRSAAWSPKLLGQLSAGSFFSSEGHCRRVAWASVVAFVKSLAGSIVFAAVPGVSRVSIAVWLRMLARNVLWKPLLSSTSGDCSLFLPSPPFLTAGFWGSTER